MLSSSCPGPHVILSCSVLRQSIARKQSKIGRICDKSDKASKREEQKKRENRGVSHFRDASVVDIAQNVSLTLVQGKHKRLRVHVMV